MANSGMRALKQTWMHGVEGNGLQWDARPKAGLDARGGGKWPTVGCAP